MNWKFDNAIAGAENTMPTLGNAERGEERMEEERFSEKHTKWTKLIQMNITTITPNWDRWILAPRFNFGERKRNWRNGATTFIFYPFILSFSIHTK